MGELIIYGLNRFIFRISEFIRHWYLEGFIVYIHYFISLLERLDRFFALKVTWRNLFRPLYQDRSIIGYILGFIFRFLRLIIGGIFYLFLIFFAVLGYLIWAAIPLFIVFKVVDYFISGKILGENFKI